MTDEVKSQMGGTLSLQVDGAPESNLVEAGKEVAPSIRGASSVRSLIFSDGDNAGEKEMMNHSITLNDDYESLASESVMSSAHTTWGSSSIEGKDPSQILVNIPGGGETTLSAAISAGYVKQVNGEYVDVKAPIDSPIEKLKDLEATNLSNEAEGLLTESLKELGSSGAMSVISQLANNTTMDTETGEINLNLNLPNNISDDAQQKIAENVEAVVPEMQQQASDYVLKNGISESEYDSFVDWFWNGGSLSQGVKQEAIMKHFDGKDLSGYDSVIREFKSTGKYHNKNK